MVIDRGSANNTGYEVGDTVPVQTQAGTSDYTLSGIARFGTADSPGGASFAMWTPWRRPSGCWASPARSARSGRRRRGRVPAPSWSRTSRTRSGADAGVEVITGAQITKENQDDIQQALTFITIFLGIFGIIAVVVGAFVIYNAFSIIVAQRTREMALLRAIGARRRQVRRAVLVEAIVVGVAGSVVGLPGRHPGGLRPVRLPRTARLVAGHPAPLVIIALGRGHPRDPVLGAHPGLAGLRVPPLAAMRDVAVDTTARSRVRFVLGVVILALAWRPWWWGRCGTTPATSASACWRCWWACC